MRFFSLCLLASLSASCLRFTPFACEGDGQCNSAMGGVCVDGGHCAYPDLDCPGGLRYDEFASGDLGGICVGAGATDSATGLDTTGMTSVTTLETTLESTLETTVAPGTSSESGSDTDTDTSDVCGGAGQSCCAMGDACEDGLECAGEACGCVRQIDAGLRHTCAVLLSGAVVCWGANDLAQLGDSASMFETVPTAAIAVVPEDPVRQVNATDHTCVRSEQGNVRCFGGNGSGQVDPALMQPTAPATPANWVPSADHVAAGLSHTCASDGISMSCWGSNGSSQLTGIDPGPGPISFGTGPVSRLESGGSFGCIVQSGTLSCWGSNAQGQLARDPAMFPSEPAPTTMPVADVDDVALGRTHTCALTNAGLISCWGRNDMGQLGDGSGAQQLAPVAVLWPPEAGTPIAIEAGDQHTCAIDDAAALWCWGSNANGQIMLEPDENGFDGYSLVPVQLDVGAGVLGVSGGSTHTCARTDTAEVLCWGTNTSGQIGDGTTNYAFVPQPAMITCQ